MVGSRGARSELAPKGNWRDCEGFRSFPRARATNRRLSPSPESHQDRAPWRPARPQPKSHDRKGPCRMEQGKGSGTIKQDEGTQWRRYHHERPETFSSRPRSDPHSILEPLLSSTELSLCPGAHVLGSQNVVSMFRSMPPRRSNTTA